MVQYPPPDLPPPGWYADPGGEAFLRYWDGRQWTSATDAVPAALKMHHCVAEVGEKQALAVATVRAMRLFVATLRDDDATALILDEVEDCAACLRTTLSFMTGLVGSLATQMAQGNKALAIATAEEQLGKAVDAARPYI